VDDRNQSDPFAGMALSQSQKAVLRKQLTTLAEHSAQPAIRDMARDLLAGRADLRGAMLGGRYEQAINEGVRQFSSWYAGLSDEERLEQTRRAQEYEQEMARASAPVPPGTRRPRPPVEDDGWEPPASILKKPKPRK
jgi:hypothetical protein